MDIEDMTAGDIGLNGEHMQKDTDSGAIRVCLVYFSPTGTTRKTLNAITEGLQPETIDRVDITTPAQREKVDEINETIRRSDLVLFGSPVYEDRLPAPVEDFISCIQGDDKRCVVIALYGDVGPGIVRSTLARVLTDKGFRVVATAAFVGEHSFSHTGFTLAAGRPDESDLEKARSFGEELAQKAFEVDAVVVDQEQLPPMARLLPLGSAHLFTKAPIVDDGRCTHCGLCALRCPVGAIDSETLAIDDERCLRCFSCVRLCKEDARDIMLKKGPLVRFFLKRKTARRKEPEWRIG